MEPTPKQYMKLENCLADGKKLGDDMYARMTALNIPIRLKVWCQKIEQHGEYS